MERPTKFEEHRWVGDKRTQVVYDLDDLPDEEASIIAELLEAETFLCFGPDTLAEARNRGYKPYKGNGSGLPDVDPDADEAE
ncbi:MAG: hypothetical protein R2726_13750 [Acidimicrobiales bacterium]